MTRIGSIASIGVAITSFSTSAFASVPVPEIGGAGSLTALLLVGGVAAVILERRRRK